MASWFYLTLDTVAPSGVTLAINGGAIYTTKNIVELSIGVSDEETTGYQMKIWGIKDVDSEETANWETFVATKSVTLTDSDGMKTIYVKVRDSVGNESAAVSDTITLDTHVPAVTVTGPDVTVISLVTTFDTSIFNFSSDVDFTEYKVCVVPATTSIESAGVQIPTTNGSINTSGTSESYPASSNIQVTLKGKDIDSVSPGGGQKIIKVFVKNAAGTWSVA